MSLRKLTGDGVAEVGEGPVGLSLGVEWRM